MKIEEAEGFEDFEEAQELAYREAMQEILIADLMVDGTRDYFREMAFERAFQNLSEYHYLLLEEEFG